MILIDQTAAATRTSPDLIRETPQGRPTLIILERDGSLQHYPPAEATTEDQHARAELTANEARPGVIARILDITFDLLGLNHLELHIHEHP